MISLVCTVGIRQYLATVFMYSDGEKETIMVAIIYKFSFSLTYTVFP